MHSEYGQTSAAALGGRPAHVVVGLPCEAQNASTCWSAELQSLQLAQSYVAPLLIWYATDTHALPEDVVHSEYVSPSVPQLTDVPHAVVSPVPAQ